MNLVNGWTFLEPVSKRWLEAQVPGCIHTDLLRHSLISDPFWGSNEHSLQWIETLDWKYRCEFTPSKALLAETIIELVADGLDTVATIRINGKPLAETENMFVGYRFEIGNLLKPGKNLLEITFGSPMKYIGNRKLPGHFSEPCDPVGGASLIRKEQCSFGWDWGPRLATCGVYLPIRLEGRSASRIERVRIRQEHTDDGVKLTFVASLSDGSTGRLGGSIRLGDKVACLIQGNKAFIRNPELWWPNGLGSQPLYDVDAHALDESGKIVDRWRKRIGLRTITLDRRPDEFGESFRFVVNGRPIFAKGANWIPAHSFVSKVSLKDYDDLLSSAARANMNMIRVWGGGIYESEDFYDLCDEKGLLVWQDFMFACALYPGTEAFKDQVEAEAAYQVSRLAHRACLALWCGNNELEQYSAQIISSPARKRAYESVFYKILPRAVNKLDGVTAYWPSSPHNPNGYGQGHNNETAGDSHFWDVWHARKPVKTYEEKKFRFCSEFGMQSYSSPEVAATFCNPEAFNVFGPEMENHQKNSDGNQIILDYISRLYRFPKDYSSLSYLSQLNQAYCMKIGIEHFRRSMPRTMGALYWQLNDCWPVASWSSLEFGGNWKALHFEAKRFFSPSLLSAQVLGEETLEKNNSRVNGVYGVDLFTIFDGPTDRRATLQWSIEHLEKGAVRSGKKAVRLCYGRSVRQVHLDLRKELREFGAASLYLRATLTTREGAISRQTIFFTAPRFLALKRSKIVSHIKLATPGRASLSLSCSTFQHAVQIRFHKSKVEMDDNFFDLFPSETRIVDIRFDPRIDTQTLKKGLSFHSLVDSC